MRQLRKLRTFVVKNPGRVEQLGRALGVGRRVVIPVRELVDGEEVFDNAQRRAADVRREMGRANARCLS